MRTKYLLCAALFCAAAAATRAQQGDKPGEVQAPLPASIQAPPAPPLNVADALKTFRLQPGFTIEVVASDPMIEAPVEIEFAPDGRLYVLEMRGFMPNVEGEGEDQPLGRVSLLEDTDLDGQMDRRSTFAEGLIMPRAIGVVHGGLLVAEPPNLWFFRDADGDGRAEHKELVSADYGNQSNPEHNANGLLWGRDNWIYSANHTLRYRNLTGQSDQWEKSPTPFRGQWGLSQDDAGRLVFNTNSDPLRGDLVPPEYFARNPHLKTAFGANVQWAKDHATFPIRVTPGVNRGYQPGTLRPDGTLAKFTGACGPLIYRGGLFPSHLYGAAFLCEPTAHLVRCNLLTESDGLITATNAFPNAEFLASTDERFRPVNLHNGPDGALYLVDMYRGVLQHRIYLTTFLRNQALERSLETPLNLGRIYRIRPEGAPRPAPLQLARADAPALVRHLDSPHGWVRDTAQQLLVERRDSAAQAPLRTLAGTGQFPGALHALWALHGLDQLDGETALRALQSADARVRAAALRAAEPFLRAEGRNSVATRILALGTDPAHPVRLQRALSLGESKSPEAFQALVTVLDQEPDSPLFRSAALSGIAGRELAALRDLLARASWWDHSTGREKTVQELARCVAESREPGSVSQLLDLVAADRPDWRRRAMVEGLAGLIPQKGKGKEPPAVKPIRFPAEPPSLALLLSAADTALAQQVKALAPLFAWPGQPGAAHAEIPPLTPAENTLFEAGKAQYVLICGACHQPNGLGVDGLAPPLVDSDWVTGSAKRLALITLHGVRGPLNVKGKVWELEMPRLDVLSDQELAALLTYVRREWGHTASPITPEYIGKIRAETEARLDAWTEAELLRIE